MKKIFLMLAAVGMLFSSCQKDENLGGAAGETLVTVTATAPQAVGTRAAMNSTSDKGGTVNVDDSKYDLRFVLRIYENNQVVKQETWAGSTQTIAYQKQYRLVPGHEYTFVVWADFVKEGTTTDLYYNTADFAAIEELPIATGDTRINNEARDAYFVTEAITIKENDNIDLTLKRPFGKVRVVTTDWNEDAIQNATVPTEVKITYNNTTLYTGMNLLTGALTGSNATMEYTAAINDYTNEGATVAEKTLYVDYLWGMTISDPTASAATITQYPVHFTIDAGIRTYDVKADVPVTRNWLTTVKGNILTTNTVINIEVDSEFDNEHTTTSQQALLLAAVNGGDVTLTEDVVLTEPLAISANMTINLNGRKISIASGNAIKNEKNLTITGNGEISSATTYGVNNAGTLVVDNAKINAIYNAGELTFNNGTIENTISGRHGIYHSGTSLIINNGDFSSTSGNELIHVANSGTATINGGTFTQVGKSYLLGAANAGIIINGGTFNGYVNPNGSNDGMRPGVAIVSGGVFNFNPSAYVADGYVATQNADGNWSVVKGVSVNNDTALISAVQNVEEGATIVLSGDITLPATNMDDTNNAALSFNNVKATIDLNGKTLKAGQADRQKMFYVDGSSDITITNGKLEIISTNGQVDGTNASTGGSNAVYCNGANVTMNNVEIIGSQRGGHRAVEVYNGVGTFTNVKIAVNYGLGVNAGVGAIVTLNDCDITVTGMYSAPYNSTCFSVMGGGQMTVTSGNYKLINNDTYNTGASHGGWVGIIMSSGGNLTLNGGTFTNVPATGFMPQYERPLFSCDAVAGTTSTLKFVGGTYAPQEDQIVHKGGSGGTEIVQIKEETLSGYSVNSALLEKMTNNGNGTWTIQ